jgi:hypothetical protein
MKCNVGGIDRILRISVGIVLVALAANDIVGWYYPLLPSLPIIGS